MSSASFSIEDFVNNESLLKDFANIDDTDIISAIKVWRNSNDKILSLLSKNLIDRKLFKTIISKDEFSSDLIEDKKRKIIDALKIENDELGYFYTSGSLVNSAYNDEYKQIRMVTRTGELIEITQGVF